MTTQPSSHLLAEFQHHSSHQFFNVQSVSLQEWGSVTARDKGEERGRGFSKNEESEPSPGTVHLTLPHKELWVDPVQLDGVYRASEIEPLTGSCATPNTHL